MSADSGALPARSYLLYLKSTLHALPVLYAVQSQHCFQTEDHKGREGHFSQLGDCQHQAEGNLKTAQGPTVRLAMALSM